VAHDPQGRTVEIVVRLAPPALGLSADEALRATARAVGVPVEPTHPGVTDPELAAWAHARVPAEEADRVVARLAARPEVEAAYVKPPGTTP
jgi:hypothetical protein